MLLFEKATRAAPVVAFEEAKTAKEKFGAGCEGWAHRPPFAAQQAFDDGGSFVGMSGVCQIRGAAHNGHETSETGFFVGCDCLLPAAVGSGAVGRTSTAFVEGGQFVAGLRFISAADSAGQTGGFGGGAALCVDGFLVFGILGITCGKGLDHADASPTGTGRRDGEATREFVGHLAEYLSVGQRREGQETVTDG